MKKVWKWIIGIFLGLVVLAVLLGVGLLMRGNFHAYRVEAFDGRGYGFRSPGMMPYGGYGYHMRAPGMMGYGIMPWGGLIGGLFSLGFLVLLVLGIVWLIRGLRKPAPAAVAVEMPAATVNACKKCGRTLQDEWKVCPHCGKRV
jgi:hypothetical protein